MMTIPNWISTFRLLLAPIIIWAMMAGQMGVACVVFLLASFSDGLDGFIARHYNQCSKLGAWLDPAADKLLLISVFSALGYLGFVPLWLVALIICRDFMISVVVMFGASKGYNFTLQPLMISKANTFAQIAFATVVLLQISLNAVFQPFHDSLLIIVAFLTTASGLAYVGSWIKFMSYYDPKN